MDESVKFQLWQRALEYQAKPIDTSELLVIIQECIENGFGYEVLNLLNAREYEEILHGIGWELFSILTPFVINEEEPAYKPEVHKIIEKIIDECSPKEVIVGIVENLQNVKFVDGFLSLLDYLQKVLIRQREPRTKFLHMSCEQVIIETKKCTQLYKKNREPISSVKEHSHALIKFENGHLPPVSFFVGKVLDFVEPFVAKTNADGSIVNNNTNKGVYKDQHITSKFVTELFDNPMSWLSFKVDSNEHDDIIWIYTRLVDTLFKCCPYFVDLFDIRNMKPNKADEHEEDEPTWRSQAGLANVLYLLLVLQIEAQYFPMVLRPEYIGAISLRPIASLLDRRDIVCINKGLALSEHVLERLEDGTLSKYNMPISAMEEILDKLIKVLIWCEEKELRKMATNYLAAFLDKVDTQGRFGLIRFLLENSEHSGVAGFLICYMKEEVNKSWEVLQSDALCYTEEGFFEFIALAFKPVTEQSRDIIEEADRILAALNFLRFIFIKGGSGEDKTGLTARIPEIEATFLEPTRTAVRQSRQTHNAYVKAKQEEIKAQKPPIDFSVETLDGQIVDTIPLKEHLQMVNIGLSTLDVIESVLARISEIICSS